MKYCPHCGKTLLEESNKFCTFCGNEINPSNNQLENLQKDNREEKEHLDRKITVISVAIIAIILVGLVFGMFILPSIQASIQQTQVNARAAIAADANSLLQPSGNDLKIVGEWTYYGGYGGKVVQRFNSDGTWSLYDNIGSDRGTWGRIKSSNTLVFRTPPQGGGTGDMDHQLTYDSSTDSLSYPSFGGKIVMTRQTQ